MEKTFFSTFCSMSYYFGGTCVVSTLSVCFWTQRWLVGQLILSILNLSSDRFTGWEVVSRILSSLIRYFLAGQKWWHLRAKIHIIIVGAIHRLPIPTYNQTDLFDRHNDIELGIIICILKSGPWFSWSLRIGCKYFSIKWKP